MREIVFRGKQVDGGEWISGDLRHWRNGKVGIHNDALGCTMVVDPESVGQYTGLKGKDGRRIFEGDIVQQWYRNGVVEYGEFNCSCCDGVYGWYFKGADIRDANSCIVIGNIHDNPELLKGVNT